MISTTEAPTRTLRMPMISGFLHRYRHAMSDGLSALVRGHICMAFSLFTMAHDPFWHRFRDEQTHLFATMKNGCEAGQLAIARDHRRRKRFLPWHHVPEHLQDVAG
jgi:hypothetical protein